jgi:hypothetical protein
MIQMSDKYYIRGHTMKISELLTENIHKKSKKPSSNLPSAASIDDEPEENDELDSEEDDIEDDKVDLGDLASYASDIGDDLWTISSLRYDGLGTAKNDKAVIAQLNKTAKDLPGLKKSINILKTANGKNGAVSSIVVNGLTGDSAVVHVEFGTEPRVMPESFLDELETNQAIKMNKILDAGSNYASALTNYFDNTDDYDAYNMADIRQERLLRALNYEDQKFPIGKLSPAEKWALERDARRKTEREARRAHQY